MKIKDLIEAVRKSEKIFFTKDDILDLINESMSFDTLEDLESNGLTISPSRRIIIRDDNVIRFPKKEFDLIYYFIKNKNINLTRKNILKNVWGSDIIVLDRTIDVHIRKIRKRLDMDCIRTNKALGYAWIDKK